MSDRDPLEILLTARCGRCRGELDRDLGLNLVALQHLAAWDHPTAGNVLEAANICRAVAVLCSTCIREKKEPIEAVEITAEGEVVYHDVATLQRWIPGPGGTG